MAAEPPTVLVEDFRPFAESKLWELQRQYFASRGQRAWSAGEVPHYITTNPVVAAAYAEVLVAFRRDRLRRDPREEALWIVELGAGSGRFAHHLLQQLAELCEREDLDPAGFRYVLSDFCAANLEAWAQHPCFAPLFASGQLERARFDVMDTSALELEHGGLRIGPGDLGAPVVVIANYLLDSIPADLLCFRQGQVERGLVRLRQRQEGGEAPEAPPPLQTLEIDHRGEPLPAAPYA
ncbi:MAG: tetratricopeptide repeat protein, partial [Cyanobacteriota bacterium]